MIRTRELIVDVGVAVPFAEGHRHRTGGGPVQRPTLLTRSAKRTPKGTFLTMTSGTEDLARLAGSL